MNTTAMIPFSAIPADTRFVRMDFFEESRLGILIQEQDDDESLRKAFSIGPHRYSYFEGGGEVPVALWSFRFPPPCNLIEVNFDLKRTLPACAAALLENRVPPQFSFFLRISGQLIHGATLGLDADAWALFQATLRRQQEAAYAAEDYTRTLQGLYHYSVEEIAAMGRAFPVPRADRAPHLRLIPGGKRLN